MEFVFLRESINTTMAEGKIALVSELMRDRATLYCYMEPDGAPRVRKQG